MGDGLGHGQKNHSGGDNLLNTRPARQIGQRLAKALEHRPDGDGDEISIGRFSFRFNASPHTKPIDDFFHKYVVTDVVEADIFGASSNVVRRLPRSVFGPNVFFTSSIS